jgi:hypothetical protein
METTPLMTTEMTTEQMRTPDAPNAGLVSYVEKLIIASAARRATSSGNKSAADATKVQSTPEDGANWVEYIDRLYIEELMIRLDH